MKQHRLELAHQHAFLARWNSVLPRQQRTALRDIRDCRTAVLGGLRLSGGGARCQGNCGMGDAQTA
jgi:hypothetical protein